METNPTIESVDDLSALAWVHDELRRSIETAHKSLRRFVRESETVTQSDVDAVDPTILRSARSHLHQGVGALELVGLSAAAEMLRASENAVQKLTARGNRMTHEAVDTIERSSFGLLDYLARMLAGKPVSPVALFPQYVAVQELAGADRIHPADLWPHDWRWRDVAPTTSRTLKGGEDTQSGIEANTLAMMRQPTPQAAADLSELYAAMANGVVADGRDRRLASLWQLGAAFFESQSMGLLKPDVYTKRIASRLLAQLRMSERSVASIEQGLDVSDRLAQDLLFFCAQAEATSRVPAHQGKLSPRLDAVRQAWGLTHAIPVDYVATKLGRFDPAWIAQAKKRVTAAKDSWSAIAADELHRMQGLVEQFHLVGDSLARLFPSGETLGAALHDAAQQTAASQVAPPAGLAMEVATALLYVEAALDDGEFDQPGQGDRVKRLADRVAQVRTGGASRPLEPWMEELYRRVADRQTMGSVVQELRGALAESEKAIDQYFRNPSQRDVLMPVPGQLQAMRGVLSVLGLEQASLTVVRMRDDVEPLLASAIDAKEAQAEGIFDRMAGNLGALGFMIDMLSVQPQMAKSLFRFDAASGLLQSVVRRDGPAARDSGFASLEGAAVVEPKLVDQVESLALQAAHPEVATEQVERDLERLAHEAMVNDQPALAETMSSVQAALKGARTEGERQEVRAELAQAMADFVASTSEATMLQPELAPLPTAMVPLASEQATPVGQTGLEGDAEMRAIFLEEAREVVDSAAEALQALESSPNEVNELTTVRRAFHTLKGSSRMVGLKDFGDAAWSCEQLYNARLADQAHADPALIAFTRDALVYMSDWVDAIDSGQARGHDSDLVRTVADALRLEGRQVPLATPTGAMPDAAHHDASQNTTVSSPLVIDVQTDLPVGVGMKTTPMHKPREAFSITAISSPMTLSGLNTSLSALMPADDNPRVVGSRASLDELNDLPLDQVNPVKADPTGRAPLPSVPLAQGIDVGAVMGPLSLDLPSQPQGLAPRETERQGATPIVTGAVAATAGAGAHKSARVLESQSRGLQADASTRAAGFADTQPAFDPAEIEAEIAAMAAQAKQAPHDAGAIEKISLAEAPDALEAPPVADPVATPTALAPEPKPRDADHNVKHIGPLRVSVPLFNIYLNEAEEQSNKLENELLQWKRDPSQPVGEAAESLAHSLAGNSATVGYGELSSLARNLEHAIKRSNDRGHGDLEEAQLFLDAADEVRKLLHQFAAGFLKTPQMAIVMRLADHERRAQGAPAPAAAAMAAPAWREVAPSTRPAGLGLGEDELDSVDALDDELFEIFEEEGLELFPRLSTHMREWVQNPADGEAANACLRALHTIKGGARLAGAMRLGELSHRLESSIEALVARGHATGQEVEELQQRVDGLGATFDVLRGQSGADLDEAMAQALPAEPKPMALVAPVVAAPVEPLVVTPVVTPVVTQGETPMDPAVAPAVAATVLAPTQMHGEPKQALDSSADVAPVPVPPVAIDWARFAMRASAGPTTTRALAPQAHAVGAVRVKAALLDRLVNHAGEVSITRSRIDADVAQLKGAITDLTDNLDRMRNQLREIELQAETQISSRLEAVKVEGQGFDPLEMDRFTRFQELTRMLAESVNDVATVHRGLQRTVQSTEDQLAAQARLTRELQDNLLRTRMVEFDSLADRLYRVVRQTAKEVEKQVRLDVVNGTIEVDRGVLERMGGSLEHLLRNCITHGIEAPAARTAAGKDAAGTVTITLLQEGNEVAIEVRDDGAGLDFERIRERAVTQGLLSASEHPSEAELAPFIFMPGFTTALTVTELAGRGVGMDVVRNEVNSLGGRVETSSVRGQGAAFKLIVPLTTAVTQVVMLRAGGLTVAMPSTLVETVRRTDAVERDRALASGRFGAGDDDLPFYWLGSLLQDSLRSVESATSALPVVVVRSAQQRVAIHVDEVLGNQEVVVKHLGPQLSRLPGLAGITLLPSGQVVLIYNPVALANLYGVGVRQAMAQIVATPQGEAAQASGALLGGKAVVPEVLAPLVLVVDDSLTVRRVTQRMLQREGYRVTLAKDGLDGLDKLAEERPAVVLSDIEMPRMDGFDMVRTLRQDDRWRDLPVIMITSRIAAKHKEHAAQLGVNHYLGKPYSEDELLQLIGQFVRAESETPAH